LFSCFLPENIKTENVRKYNSAAVLHGCGTWSLGQREETRSVQREMFGTNREEVTGLQRAAWTGTAPLTRINKYF
jgi:hypothetical protein